jgi:hypothetical protein
MSRSTFQKLYCLLTLAAVALALGSVSTARSEAFDPPVVTSHATVQIESAKLSPASLNVSSGQHLVFHNDSAGMARVELDLERGEGIVCGSTGEQPAKGRKFVVASGADLECEAPAVAVGYRVFHSGSGPVVESSGRIEVSGN